jgi:hypothetical protein
MPPSSLPSLAPRNIDEAVRLAQMMAKGRLVPAHLQDSPADCLMVIEQAVRWRMSPLAVAQCTSVIHGKLMHEGKLVAAVLNTSGLLATRLQYTFKGEGANRTVTVSARLVGETDVRVLEVRLADVVTKNDAWRSQPDQQLCYSGARVWARRYVPEVMLGVYVPEEFDDVGVVATQGTVDLMPRPKEIAAPAGAGGEDEVLGSVVSEEREPVPAQAQERPHPARSESSAAAPAGKPISESMLRILRKKAAENNVSEKWLCERFGVTSLESLHVGAVNEAIRLAAGGEK